MKYINQIKIQNQSYHFPIYLPDATRGVVRSVSSEDLKSVGIEGVMVNTYHLMQSPGLEVLRAVGGVKNFMNFNGFVSSDSGGFQIMSLIHKKKLKGKITSEGAAFTWRRLGKNERVVITPENIIAAQFDIGSNLITCLDYFTNPEALSDEIEKSVNITIEWAKRAKEAYLIELEKRKIAEKDRPLLMAPIQGGENKKLRAVCAKALLKIGFDAYGYGGWPLNAERNFNSEMFAYNASLTPDDKLRFALGVGRPTDIVEGTKVGYHIFDCVLPTRDARHHRLYILRDNFKENLFENKDLVEFMYINRSKYNLDNNPVSMNCDCLLCQNYSRAYLHHLFKIKDSLAWRLASIHNLRTYTRVVGELREKMKR
jgi:queuine tRNA-ribosyltransferase